MSKQPLWQSLTLCSSLQWGKHISFSFLVLFETSRLNLLVSELFCICQFASSLISRTLEMQAPICCCVTQAQDFLLLPAFKYNVLMNPLILLQIGEKALGLFSVCGLCWWMLSCLRVRIWFERWCGGKDEEKRYLLFCRIGDLLFSGSIGYEFGHLIRLVFGASVFLHQTWQ